MAEAVIQVEGLGKSYRTGLRRQRVQALTDLNFEVERGRVVAFLGPNGAGKTTTLSILLGLLEADTGSVLLLGRPAGDTATRGRLGFQSEIFYTYPFRTCEGALRFYGRLSGMGSEQLRQAVPRQLERLGLSGAARRKVGTFSKGMVQRLGLAQALLHEPELLLLDEPTTGLDPEGRKLVADLILEEKARGTTVFFSSHILADVERLCDRVIFLRDGRAVLSADIGELTRAADEWEVEVCGWGPRLQAELEGVRVARAEAERAFLLCTTQDKPALLRRLLDLSAEIGVVRRSARSLEDHYMELLGGASRG